MQMNIKILNKIKTKSVIYSLFVFLVLIFIISRFLYVPQNSHAVCGKTALEHFGHTESVTFLSA